MPMSCLFKNYRRYNSCRAIAGVVGKYNLVCHYVHHVLANVWGKQFSNEECSLLDKKGA